MQIKIPDGTILSPDDNAAVVGGNVQTSQRICDVIFRAFEAVAASQGTNYRVALPASCNKIRKTKRNVKNICLIPVSNASRSGCMNNITFGDDRMGGYYETVAGGAGAGDGFHGRSGVHVHMTNTRITDPEILESR